MKRNLIAKRAGAVALATTIAASTGIVNVMASDIAGHWAEGVMVSWQQQGLISGFSDGTLRPDAVVTRAQFVSMVNNTLGFTYGGSLNFSDVSQGDWFYTAVSVAVAAGYANGTSATTFAPNSPVTREQAAVFIYNALNMSPGNPYVFYDSMDISTWARDAVGAMYDAGYMSGKGNNRFDPGTAMTRAEAVSFLDRVKNGGVTTPTVTTPTVTVPSTSTTTTSGDVEITRPSTTLEDETIKGDLTITNTVMEGTVYLNNVTVEGDLYVKGGSKLYLDDVTVKGTVYMVKNNMYMELAGATDLSTVEIEKYCYIDAGTGYSGSIDTVNFNSSISRSLQTRLDVDISRININEQVSVKIERDVDTLVVDDDAEGTLIELSSTGYIDELIANGRVAISGNGDINTLRANASGITIESGIDIIYTRTASGVTEPTIGSNAGDGNSGESNGDDTSTDDDANADGGTATAQTVNIGTGQDYTTLSAAITDLTDSTVPVTFVLHNDIVEGVADVSSFSTMTATYSGSGTMTIETKGYNISGNFALSMTAATPPSLTITGAGTISNFTFSGGDLSVEPETTNFSVVKATSLSMNSATNMSLDSLEDLTAMVVSGAIHNFVVAVSGEQALTIIGTGTIAELTINGTASETTSLTLEAAVQVDAVTTKVSTTLSGTGVTESTDVKVNTATTTTTGQLTVVVPDVVTSVTVEGDTGNTEVENASGNPVEMTQVTPVPVLNGVTSAKNGATVSLTAGTVPSDVKWYYTTDSTTPTAESTELTSTATITLTGPEVDTEVTQIIKVIAIENADPTKTSEVLIYSVTFAAVDLSAWNIAVAEFDALAEADYTTDSWSAFVTKIQESTIELTQLYSGGTFTTPSGQTTIDAATLELTSLLANSGLEKLNPNPDEPTVDPDEPTVDPDEPTVDPTPEAAPVILDSTGTAITTAPVVGETILKAFADDQPTALEDDKTVTWYAGGVEITDATAVTYTVSRADYGKTITAKVGDSVASDATLPVTGQDAMIATTDILAATAPTGLEIDSTTATIEVTGGIVIGDSIKITTVALRTTETDVDGIETSVGDTGTQIYIDIDESNGYIVTISIASDDNAMTTNKLNAAIKTAIADYNELGGLTVTLVGVTVTNTATTADGGDLLGTTKMTAVVVDTTPEPGGDR